MKKKEVTIPIEEAVVILRKYVPEIIFFYLSVYILYNFRFFWQCSFNQYINANGLAAFYFFDKKEFIHIIFHKFHFSIMNFLLFILLIVAGTILHEFLHALSAIILSGGKFRSVTFGIHLKTFSPYTHCKASMKIWKYRIILLSPGIILGVAPALFGIINRQPSILFFGIFFTIGALGDYLIFKILMRYDKNLIVKDHKDKLGFIILS